MERGVDMVHHGTLVAATGHYVGGIFKQFWETRGGLADFGYPLTGELIEPDGRTGQARIVQYFERARFERGPEVQSGPSAVQLGRLGETMLLHGGTPWATLPRREKGDPGCRLFPETGKQICRPFLTWWEQHGVLQRHGLPLSDAFAQGGQSVQYFERSRLEWNGKQGPSSQLHLGLVGSELYVTWNRWE